MNFKLKPMDHQLINFETTKDKIYFGNIAEMGTGKSKMLLDVAAHIFLCGHINTLLVFCNSGSYQEWMDHHIPTHMTDDVTYEVMEWSSKLAGKKLKTFLAYLEERPKQGILKIVTANVESLSYKRSFTLFQKFVKNTRCLVAIDESSALKNPTSGRTKAAFKLRDVSTARRILTGSPIDNRPLDAWSQLEFLNRGASGHTSFYSFKTHYADLKPHYRSMEPKDRAINKSKLERYIPQYEKSLGKSRALNGVYWIRDNLVNNYNFDKMQQAVIYIEQYLKDNTFLIDQLYILALGRINLVTGYKNLEEFRKMLSEVCFIVKSDDCLDLPDKIYMTRNVELTTEQAKLYKQIKEEALAILSEEAVLTIPMILTQNLRCQQIVNGLFKPDDGALIKIKHNRLKVLQEIIDETDENIFIFSELVESIKEIETFLSEQYGANLVRAYYGEVSQEARREAKTAVRDGKARFFIANKTGAHGLTLIQLTTMIFYDMTFDAEIDNQVQKRIHRIGQTRPVKYIRMVARGTVDDKKLKSLTDKKELSDYLVQSNWKDMF